VLITPLITFEILTIAFFGFPAKVFKTLFVSQP
jgi:hypothetical protein